MEHDPRMENSTGAPSAHTGLQTTLTQDRRGEEGHTALLIPAFFQKVPGKGLRPRGSPILDHEPV